MDQQTPEVEEEKQEEEKPKGFIARLIEAIGRLFGGAGSSAGAGAGAGAAGGGVAAGGLLASKAAVVGMIVAGTTIAGGLGIVGYNAFKGGGGGGSSAIDENGEEQFSSIFEARAKQDVAQVEDRIANENSDSLEMFVKANNPADSGQPGAGAAPAISDASQAGAASGSGSANTMKALATPSANAPAPAPKISGGVTLGALSKGLGSASSGASFQLAQGPTGGGLAPTGAGEINRGQSASGFRAGANRRFGDPPGSRPGAGRGFGKAFGQARAVNTTPANRGGWKAPATANLTTMPNTPGGGDNSSVGKDGKVSGNTADGGRNQDVPLAGDGYNVTPDQGNMDTAKWCAIAAAAAMVIAVLMLHSFYDTYITEYNNNWQTLHLASYAKCVNTAHVALQNCLTPIPAASAKAGVTGCITSCGPEPTNACRGACTAAGTSYTTTQEGQLNANIGRSKGILTGAVEKLQAKAAQAAAEAAKSQGEAAAKKTRFGDYSAVVKANLIGAAQTESSATSAQTQTDQQKANADRIEIEATVSSAGKSAVEPINTATAAMKKGCSAFGPIGGPACGEAESAADACVATYNKAIGSDDPASCSKVANAEAAAKADALATEKAGIWRGLAVALGSVATILGLVVMANGVKILADNVGQNMVGGWYTATGALLAGAAGWLTVNTILAASTTNADAAANDGQLTHNEVSQFASWGGGPGGSLGAGQAIWTTIGGVAAVGALVPMFGWPKPGACGDEEMKDVDCCKHRDCKASIQFERRGFPSEHALDEYLAGSQDKNHGLEPRV